MTPELKTALKTLAQADKALLDLRGRAAGIESELTAIRARIDTAKAEHQAAILASVDPAARHARAQEIAALLADAEGLTDALASMRPGMADAEAACRTAQDAAQAAHGAAWSALEREAMATHAEALGRALHGLVRISAATGTCDRLKDIVRNLVSMAEETMLTRESELLATALHPTLPEPAPVSSAL